MGQELGRISGVMLKENLEIFGPYLRVDDDLLYIDPVNKGIGINSNATDAQTSLVVNSSTKTIELIVDTELKLPNLTIKANTNTISSVTGDLHLASATSIISPNIRTDDLNLNDNVISSTSSNQSIELRPLGAVEIPTDLNVTGNLFATGDILIEGTVVFGDTTDAVTETVNIKAEIDSDIIPTQNRVFSLGTDTDPTVGRVQWLNLYTGLVNGEAITATSVQANGVNLTQRQGKTWYVSKNGSDTNFGNHEASTFLTIKHALEFVDLEPEDTIIIYPGEYEELTPLVVPQGVSIRGTSLRSVKITADPTTIDHNVFELNGETTVTNVTVANFRYNATNDTGYAFSFADNFTVTSRSPYVQDVSVITSGSVTTLADPRGFASGDAGKGALVDGSKALSTSKEASMLFHSVTFITPGVDGLTVRNGVRVEWINSFVYFANKAMYATSGTLGFGGASNFAVGGIDTIVGFWGQSGIILSGAGGKTITVNVSNTGVVTIVSVDAGAAPGTYTSISGTRWIFVTGKLGAEVRSIGSACVYGNYGAWAEGPGTLMYLINHNFSYIGAGKDSTNDPSVHNAENEITMLDTGDIHYQSFDNDGHFHIGNPFSVSFNDGTATINGVGLTAVGVSSILFGSPTSETVITSELVSTGNIKFNGNKISSLAGDINLAAGTDLINLEYDVSAKNNISIDNNFSLKGALTLGNDIVDITEFKAPTNTDILPATDRLYGLGSDYLLTGLGPEVLIPGRRWNKVINQLTVIDNNIQLFDNVIQTSQSNSNLELRTHGAGKILLENNALTITNQLTVNGDTSTQSISVVGNINQLGDILQTGDRSISNGVDLTGNISATVEAQLETITISQGSITTTASNADLELRAAGTGQIVFPTSSVLIQHNLTVNGTMTAGDAVIAGDVVAATFNNADITVTANQITTINSNSNLELRAHGTGEVIAPLADVEITQDLTVDALSTLSNLITVGDKVHIGNLVQTGTLSQTGNYQLSKNLTVTENAYFTDIEIVNNNISTRTSNSDLEFTAAGTGQVTVPTSNVLIENNLTVDGLMTANNAIITNDIVSSQFDIPDISIYANTIVTRGTDQDLVLGAHSNGLVISETSDVTITQDLQVDGLSTFGNAVITGDTNHTGLYNLTGDVTQTGNYSLSNNLTVSLGAQFANIEIENNVITTTDSNSDLELRALGSGLVKIDDNFRIENNLNIIGITATNGLSNSGTITSNKFSDGNILISDNYITTTTGDLTLAPNNNGLVSVAADNVLIDNDLQVDGTSTLGNTVVGLTTTTTITAPIVIATPEFYSNSNDELLSPFTFVSSSGNYAIIGQSGANSAAGSAKIYNVTTGQLIHTLSDPAAGDYWGQGVAIDGNYAVVTDYVPRLNGLFPWYTSVISVFDVTTGNLLRSIAVDPNAGTGLGLELGPCIDISGNYAILGGRRRARIYDITTGNLVHNLVNPITGSGWFGRSVAISGNYAIVGDPEALSSRGVAYIFNVTTGLLIRTINSPSFQTTNLFGGAVSTDGNRVIIGAPKHNTPASQSGIAYIFDVATGNLVHTFVNPGAAPSSDRFGTAVSLDGNYAVVSAYNTGFFSGTVYLFDVTTGNLVLTWDNPNIDNILNAPGRNLADFFGTSVSLSGNTIIAGGGGDNGGTTFITSILAPNPAILTVTGTINRTGNTIETGNYTLSNNLTVTDTATLSNIDIVNNVITTSDSNSDLELRATSGNIIRASYGNVTITPELQVNGITATTTINNSGVVYSDTFKTADLIISQNYITSNNGTNIKLIAAGSGNVVLPRLTFDSNSIRATTLNNSINLTVSSGSVTIPTTNALKIPVGTTANKSVNTVGDIRLDTTDTLFTGWNGARVTFGGLFSTDRRTTVLAHPTNNSINFVTNTNANMSLTASGLTVNTLLVNSDLQFTGTTISSTVSGSNITLTPNNNGYLELGNIRINTNNIQNVDTSSNIILENTGNGYVRFGGTGGIVIPAGNELSRPVDPEVGDFRFNTNLSTAEVFNGIEYVSLSGTSATLLTAEEISEITNIWGLILG